MAATAGAPCCLEKPPPCQCQCQNKRYALLLQLCLFPGLSALFCTTTGICSNPDSIQMPHCIALTVCGFRAMTELRRNGSALSWRDNASTDRDFRAHSLQPDVGPRGLPRQAPPSTEQENTNLPVGVEAPVRPRPQWGTGVYIPPHRMKELQKHITDPNTPEFQRIQWDALRKSLNGLINKVGHAMNHTLRILAILSWFFFPSVLSLFAPFSLPSPSHLLLMVLFF